MKTLYHRRHGRPLPLRGCYVFSGLLSMAFLDQSGSSDGWNPAHGDAGFQRWYADGLKSADGPQDCTIVIWRKDKDGKALGKKGSAVVIRTRSKVSSRCGILCARAKLMPGVRGGDRSSGTSGCTS